MVIQLILYVFFLKIYLKQSSMPDTSQTSLHKTDLVYIFHVSPTKLPVLYICLFIKKYFLNILNVCRTFICRGRRGRDRMVVGFITIYAISAYHH